jgi:hypothetical protein
VLRRLRPRRGGATRGVRGVGGGLAGGAGGAAGARGGCRGGARGGAEGVPRVPEGVPEGVPGVPGGGCRGCGERCGRSGPDADSGGNVRDSAPFDGCPTHPTPTVPPRPRPPPFMIVARALWRTPRTLWSGAHGIPCALSQCMRAHRQSMRVGYAEWGNRPAQARASTSPDAARHQPSSDNHRAPATRPCAQRARSSTMDASDASEQRMARNSGWPGTTDGAEQQMARNSARRGAPRRGARKTTA